jgi:hypothetical protein
MRTFTLTLLCLIAAPAVAVDAPLPKSVLFVGNSFTYGNDLPGMVGAMAAARGHEIEVGTIVRGGYTLEKHVGDGKAAEMIRGRKWGVVVLQEQSFRPVAEPDKLLQFARALNEVIDKQGAETVFFLTWAYRDHPEMQAGLDKGYTAAADELGAKVAPVGPAWQRAMASESKPELHAKDGRHPNPAGSYLAACVFYAVLFERSPMGLPAELHKGEKTLVKLTAAEAAALQEIAFETVKQWKKK